MSSSFSPLESLLSHKNNIIQKKRLSQEQAHQDLCSEIEKKYADYLGYIRPHDIVAGELGLAVDAVGEYLDFAKVVESENKRFNWRSDYASSVLPEFIYRILGVALAANGIVPIFSTRDSIVEVSLSGAAGGGWDLRKKNQDLCVGIRRERVVRPQGEELFLIPLIAMEVKTNIDINKLNGLDFSAERLKRTFPSSRYILVTETIDFSLSQNYASGSIDEIYTLRKQLRSLARKNKENLKADVFARLVEDVVDFIKKSSVASGHVYTRIENGKLINA